MFCPKCGTENPAGAKFCKGCGSPLPQSAPAQPGSTLPGAYQAGMQWQAFPAGVKAASSAPAPARRHRWPLAIAFAAIAAVVLAGVMTNRFGLFGLMVKGSVNDYSWAELKTLSRQITDASSDEQALSIAEKYHLCTADGRLDGTQTKDVTLTDGTKTSVAIIGFRHDDKADGTGKAGITFVFAGRFAQMGMMPVNTNSNYGGWRGTQARSWLESTGLNELPDDLKDSIVSVTKQTNNHGEESASEAVTPTEESLWLCFYVELGGNLSNWSTSERETLGKEGSAYKVFTDAFDGGSSVRRTLLTDAWERTPDPESSYKFMIVDSSGSPNDSYDANGANEITPGFCI